MTKIIAHAGCENTISGSIESIELALKYNVDMIEIDVRGLGEIPVLSHDPINSENDQNLVTMQKVIDIIKDTDVKLNCDLKDLDVFEDFKTILTSNNFASRVILTGAIDIEKSVEAGYAFYLNMEHVLDNDNDDLMTEEMILKAIEFYKNNRSKEFVGYNINYKTLSVEMASLFKQNEIPICCWTIDDTNEIEKFLNLEVENITTNKIIYALEKRIK